MPDSQLPSHASVVVIGGGVMGCSTLYHLALGGVADAILEGRQDSIKEIVGSADEFVEVDETEDA